MSKSLCPSDKEVFAGSLSRRWIGDVTVHSVPNAGENGYEAALDDSVCSPTVMNIGTTGIVARSRIV